MDRTGTCCALAANENVVAPPSKVMNSRRRMSCPRSKGRSLPQHGTMRALYLAAKYSRLCRLGVNRANLAVDRHFRSTPKNGHRQTARACPVRASYRLMRRSKERRSLKSPMRFLRDLGIWRTSGRLSERNFLRIASTVGQVASLWPWANALLPPRPARPKSGEAAFMLKAFAVRASRLLCSRRPRPEAFAAARRVD